MAYRDDLEAALARAAALEAECARLRALPTSTPSSRSAADASAFTKLLLTFLTASACVVAVVGYSAFWISCLLNYTKAPGCNPIDNWCKAVRAWPSWVHPIGLGSPLILLVVAVLIISWREAKKGAQ